MAKRRPNFRLTFALMLALLVVASLACGGAQEPPPAASGGTTPGPASPAAVPTVVMAQPSPAVTAEPSNTADGPEGTLSIGMPTFGNESFVPATLRETGALSLVTFPAFDTMLQLDTSDGKLISGAVEQWEMGSDATSYDLTLREGMTFHDGSPIGLDDLIYSMDLHRNEKAAGSFKESVINIVEVDENTARVELNRAWPTMLWEAWHRPGGGGPAEMYPKSLLEDAQAATNWPDNWGQNPVGSGPFKFASQTFGSDARFTAFTDFWQGSPDFEELHLRLIPEDTTRIALLETGEVDVIETSLLDVDGLRNGGFGIITVPGALSTFFFFSGLQTLPGDPGFDTSLPWVADPNGPPDEWEQARNIRKAFNLAIERDTIGQVIYKDIADMVAVPWTGTGVPGSEQIADLQAYPFQPEEARQLLEENDFPMDMRVRIASFTLSGAGEMPALAEAVATMFETNLGITTELFPTDYRSTVGPPLTQRERPPFEISVMRHSMRSVASDNAKYFTKSYGSAYCRMLGDDLDEMYQESAAALDIAVQEELAAKVWREVYDEYCVIPIATSPFLIAVGERVVDWPLQPGNPRLHNYQYVTKADNN